MRNAPLSRLLAATALAALALALPACGGGGSSDGPSSPPQYDRPNDADTGAGQGTTPADVQWHLDWLNAVRVDRGLTEFTLKPEINAFALDGVELYASNGVAHQHFNDAGNAIFSMGFVSAAGENQGFAGGYATAREAWDVVLDAMMAEENQFPPGAAGRGHFETIVDARYTHVGIGIIIVGTRAYLTHDFSGG